MSNAVGVSSARIASLLVRGARAIRERGILDTARRVWSRSVDRSRSDAVPWWVSKYTPSSDCLRAMEAQSRAFPFRPCISVVLPVYNTEASALREVIQSVQRQAYDLWELCIADDCSTAPHVRAILEEVSKEDPRIKVVYRPENGHISHASNSALSMATGEFIALLDHDDTLAPHALFRIVEALNKDPSLDMVYSDEDKLAGLGSNAFREEPAFKAEWSPIYFMSFMYVGHIGVYRTSLVREVGGFRPGFEGSQDYDLVLRLTERTSRIRHVNDILYHWRKYPGSVAGDIDAKPYAFRAASRALNEALHRRGISGEVEGTSWKGIYRVRPKLPNPLPIIEVPWEGNLSQDLQKVKGKDQYALVVSPLCSGSADSVRALLEAAVVGDGGVVGGVLMSPEQTILAAGFARSGRSLGARFRGERHGAIGYCARLVAPHDVEAVPCDAMLIRGDVIGRAVARASQVQPSTTGEWAMLFSIAARELGTRVIFTPWALFQCIENYPATFSLSPTVYSSLSLEGVSDLSVPRGILDDPESRRQFLGKIQ